MRVYYKVWHIPHCCQNKDRRRSRLPFEKVQLSIFLYEEEFTLLSYAILPPPLDTHVWYCQKDFWYRTLIPNPFSSLLFLLLLLPISPIYSVCIHRNPQKILLLRYHPSSPWCNYPVLPLSGILLRCWTLWQCPFQCPVYYGFCWLLTVRCYYG